MQFQVNVRVERKNQIKEMAGSFTLPVGDQKCTVSYSKRQDKTVRASLVPENIETFQKLPNKVQKQARHEAMNEIKKRIG